MFTSNVQLSYPCPRGGGEAVQAGLSCPPPPPPAQDLGQTVSSVNSYCTIILEYLVVRDVNIILVKLTCLHPAFSLVILVGGVGGKLSRLVYLAHHPEFGSNSVISQFLLHHNLGLFSCMRYKHYFSQTEMFASNVQFGYPCSRGGGQSIQAGLSCPHQGFRSGSVISQFLLLHNLGIFSCKRYKHYFGRTEMFVSKV